MKKIIFLIFIFILFSCCRSCDGFNFRIIKNEKVVKTDVDVTKDVPNVNIDKVYIKGDKGDKGDRGWPGLNGFTNDVRVIYSGDALKEYKTIQAVNGYHLVILNIYNMSQDWSDFNQYYFSSGNYITNIIKTETTEGNSSIQIIVETDKDGNIVWRGEHRGKVTITLLGYFN